MEILDTVMKAGYEKASANFPDARAWTHVSLMDNTAVAFAENAEYGRSDASRIAYSARIDDSRSLRSFSNLVHVDSRKHFSIN